MIFVCFLMCKQIFALQFYVYSRLIVVTFISQKHLFGCKFVEIRTVGAEKRTKRIVKLFLISILNPEYSKDSQ